MQRVYFISADDLVKYSVANLNVEVAFIRQAIIDAEYIDIYQELGAELFEKIEALAISGMGDAGNEKYKELFDNHIYNITIECSLARVLDYDRFKIFNKGVNTQESVDSSKADFNEFLYFKKNSENKSKFYINLMKDYLCANLSSFPEYSQFVNGKLPAKISKSTGNIMFQ